MKNLKPLLFIFIVLMFAASGFPQRKFGGTVVDVVDGKTVVIELESRRLTAVLQYIEIPEREQPLYWTVRTHLEKLALGKTVEFNPLGILPGKTFGHMYIGGVDIAQQMLRDGAAWHINVSQSGQAREEFEVYQFNEGQAKAEKRGVWGVKDLKPAWQFRTEKIESSKRAEDGKQQAHRFEQAAAGTAPAKRTADKKPGYWGDTNPALKNVGALLNGYNAKTRTGYVGTSLLGVTEPEKDKAKVPDHQKTAVDITYHYREDERKGRTGVFVVSVVSLADEWRFLKNNDLVVEADEKTTFIGRPKRTTFVDGDQVGERLIYEVSRSAIEKFVNGGDIVIKVGTYRMRPQHGLQLLLYNMLKISE